MQIIYLQSFNKDQFCFLEIEELEPKNLIPTEGMLFEFLIVEDMASELKKYSRFESVYKAREGRPFRKGKYDKETRFNSRDCNINISLSEKLFTDPFCPLKEDVSMLQYITGRTY